jgi:hypothetical protein
MAEAITILGFVATVVQLVDFTSKLISDGREVYKHGQTLDNRELEVLTKDLLDLSANFKQAWSGDTQL